MYMYAFFFLCVPVFITEVVPGAQGCPGASHGVGGEGLPLRLQHLSGDGLLCAHPLHLQADPLGHLVVHGEVAAKVCQSK